MSPGVIAGLAVVAGFLLGSLPASHLAGRWSRGIDLREHGSGNLGATNVFRVLGWRIALPVVLVDIGKGALAVAIGLSPGIRLESVPDLVGLLAGIAAILGHSFSPFVRFQGGKGVATAAGAFLTLAPWGAIPAVAVWILLLGTTRIMSIASVAAAAVLPVSVISHELRNWGDGVNWATLVASVLVGALVLLRHRANLQRLRDGTEKALW